MFSCLVFSSSAEEKKSFAEFIYKTSEALIRDEWLKALDFARLERARKENSGERPLSAQQEKEGMNGVQNLLYNKAVILATCAGVTAKSGIDEAVFRTASTECIDAKLMEMGKFVKLSEYADAVSKAKMNSCEMRSRDYENELRFIPYDFLHGKDMRLFDFKAFNSCLLSN
jgi:hypothetical protein